MLNVGHSNKTSHNSGETDVTHTPSGHSDLQKENVKVLPPLHSALIKVNVLCTLTRCRILKIAYFGPWNISINLIKAFLNTSGFYPLVFIGFPICSFPH